MVNLHEQNRNETKETTEKRNVKSEYVWV